MNRTATSKIVTMPTDAKARRARQLAAAWSKEDELIRQLRDLRAGYRSLQGEVSQDCGYRFTVSRANLELALKARRP
jgi:hypothetical protein